jgi:DNA-directed RNA polymerase specialized sigma24 family protein
LDALLALTIMRQGNDENETEQKAEELLARVGLPVEAIGRITGKSEGAVRKQLERAGVRLRKAEHAD